MKINGDLRFRTLGSGEIQNAVIERVAGGATGSTLPTGVEGRIAFNTDSDTYWFYGGSQWNEFGGGGDISNIIASGGYMTSPSGTFDPTAFATFTNVNNAGSPFTSLVDALAQMDDAISTAAGVDTLDELTDVNLAALSTGQLLYYKDGTTKWTQTSVTALSDGDVLTWNNSSSTWEPTDKAAVNALEDLTDVDDAVTSGATDGQVLRYNSGAAAGAKWSSEDLGYIRTSDGDTYISLTGAGAINPRTDGNSIHFYVDTGSAELVARFLTTEIELNAPAGTGGGNGGVIDINAGSGAGSGSGGTVSIDGGSTDSGQGGAITLNGGSTTLETSPGGAITLTGGTGTSNGGAVTLQGGTGSGSTTGARVVVGSGQPAGSDGSLTLNAGSGGGGTDGAVNIYSGTTGTGDGIIAIQTAGHADIRSPYTEITNTTAANAGVVRFQEGTTNGTDYVRVQAPDALGASIAYSLPAGLASPDDATYILGTDSLTTGGATVNEMKWVSATAIGGNSFATWSNSGGTGDVSVIAETTSDTVTLTSSQGVNIDFNATTDVLTFSMSSVGLTSTNVIAGADVLWFDDGGVNGTTSVRTFTNMLADLDIVNSLGGNGIAVQDATDSYVARSIVASTTAGLEGIDLVNGNGVSGNPSVGLDIASLSGTGTDTIDNTNDLLLLYNYDKDGGSPVVLNPENQMITVSELAAAIGGTGGISLKDLGDVDSGLSPSSGHVLYYTGTTWTSDAPGATSGVQSHDASLDSIAGLSLSVNSFIYVTDGSPETFSTITSGTTGRALLGDETVADAITTLGLGSGGVSDIWVDVAGDTMTGNLVMSGTAVVQLINGASGTPSLTFASDTDTGLYGTGSNGLVFVTGGADRVTLDSSGNTTIETGVLRVQDGAVGTPSYTFESDTDTGLYSVETDILGVSAGGAQRLKIYGKNAEISGSPPVETTAGAISVESTASYETLIGDPSSSGFTTPVDDFLPNAQWVDLYYLRKSGGTMTGDLIFSGADIDMGGNNIINVAAPTNGTDAANKTYVDSLITGLTWKNSVIVATDSNIASLSSGAPNTVDGVSLSVGDRILVRSQTTAAQNGIYVVDTVGTGSNGVWSRASDMDSAGSPGGVNEINGAAVYVEQGSTYADTGWTQTEDVVDLDVDDIAWVQFTGASQLTAGIGLGKSGNVLFVNLGAGIFEQPGDEVGIELYNRASGAIILTTDGTTRSVGAGSPPVAAAASKLHLLLSATGGIDQGTAGLFIKSNGVVNDMLVNSSTTFIGDSGTPQTISLGDDVTFKGDGTTGITVAAAAGAGSPLQSSILTFTLSSVPNSALTNNSIGFADGTTTDEVALGEDTTITGGIVGANTFKIRRIEDADGDTYVETSTGVADDSDTVSLVVPGGTSATLSAAEIDLTAAAAVDINATTTVAIDSGTTTAITGGTGVTLTATTGDTSIVSTAGNVLLDGSTSVQVRDNVDLRLMDADSSAYIGHKSAAVVTTSITYTWPEAPAGNDYVLVSTTGGTLSWASPSTVGRTRIEDLDDVVITLGSPGESYTAGDILVGNGGSPRQFVSQQIQYIYDSTLTTPTGSPLATSATSHSIKHSLGQKYVNVTVYNTSDQQIIPQSVTLTDANNLTVTFNAAIDCTVVIVGVPGVVAANGV